MHDTQVLLEKVSSLEEKIAKLESVLATPKLYTTRDFALMIGRSPRWVGEMVRAGKIYSVTAEHPFMIPHTEYLRIFTNPISIK